MGLGQKLTSEQIAEKYADLPGEGDYARVRQLAQSYINQRKYLKEIASFSVDINSGNSNFKTALAKQALDDVEYPEYDDDDEE